MSDDRISGSMSRPRHRIGGALVTGCVMAGALGFIVVGQMALSAQRAAGPAPDPAPRTTVRTSPVVLKTAYTVERRFAGQFEARQRISQGFEEGGTVSDILVEEGDRVRTGDVLARIDTALLIAERDRLEAARDGIRAQVELARRTDARQADLRDQGFSTEQAVDDTSLTLLRLEASLAEVEAALRAVDVRLEKAVLRAPFDGIVGTRLLDLGAVAGPGAPVLDLLEIGPVRFRAGLAPDAAAGLAAGDPAVIEVDGRRLRARVTQIAPELDPATRARVVVFEVDAETVPPARSGGAVLVSRDLPADPPGAWIPLAGMRHGSAGTWEVLTVSGGRIVAEAVEIVHAEAGRAFVRGTLAPGAELVDAGPHRVVPGESVAVSEDIAWAR